MAAIFLCASEQKKFFIFFQSARRFLSSLHVLWGGKIHKIFFFLRPKILFFKGILKMLRSSCVTKMFPSVFWSKGKGAKRGLKSFLILLLNLSNRLWWCWTLSRFSVSSKKSVKSSRLFPQSRGFYLDLSRKLVYFSFQE